MKPAVKRPAARQAARDLCCAVPVVLMLALEWPAPVLAHQDPSEASAISGLSVAVSVSTPVLVPAAVLSAGASLVVVSVQAVSTGTLWVLERASDGARLSVILAGGASVAVGTTVSVVVTGAGWVLSQAGKALCFIPNEIGASLLYNEQLTR